MCRSSDWPNRAASFASRRELDCKAAKPGVHFVHISALSLQLRFEVSFFLGERLVPPDVASWSWSFSDLGVARWYCLSTSVSVAVVVAARPAPSKLRRRPASSSSFRFRLQPGPPARPQRHCQRFAARPLFLCGCLFGLPAVAWRSRQSPMKGSNSALHGLDLGIDLVQSTATACSGLRPLPSGSQGLFSACSCRFSALAAASSSSLPCHGHGSGGARRYAPRATRRCSAGPAALNFRSLNLSHLAGKRL